MNVLEWFLNLLYPRRCLSCGKFGQYICDHCLTETQFIDKDICPVCRKPAIDGKTHPKCQTRYSLDGLTSFFGYQGVIREAIKRIKYKPFAYDISKVLVSLVLERINEKDWLAVIIRKNPVLVPIPLHRSRERVRGFNQAEILGKILAEKWDLQILPDLLIRTRKTKPQYELRGKERKKNVQKAFKINPNYQSQLSIINLPAGKAGCQFLIFDDLWTTGVTMRTCGNLLKRAGAKSVWGLTMAR